MRISSILSSSAIVFYGNLGLLRNEELLCDYHQLLAKSLSPNERKESSKQLRPRSVSGQVHINLFFRRSERSREKSVSYVREGFVEVGTPATNSGRRLHTLEEV